MTMKNVFGIFLTLILLAVILTGCVVPEQTPSAEKDPVEAIDLATYNKVPKIDEFDPGMEKAHFLSAPTEQEMAQSADNSVEENKDFTALCSITVENTSACFVLGNKKGEYGQLILGEIDTYGEEGIFRVKVMQKGAMDSSFAGEDISFPKSDDGVYRVELEVKSISSVKSTMGVAVNDAHIGNFDVPAFSLGCVGFYKSRGTRYAYADDIKVTSKDGEELFADDFDGHFSNMLFGYNYKNTATSAFSPYFYKTTYRNDSNALVVSSGFILSETKADTAPVFRKKFEAKPKTIKGAYLYMTALGSFEASINGTKVSKNLFDPGKTVFNEHLYYVSYDVTDLIQENNTLEITLFNGFFDRGAGYPEVMQNWGGDPAIKGELVIQRKDGEVVIIPTDESFDVCSNTRYRFNDIYQGEIIDDRYTVEENSKWVQPLVDAVEEKYLDLPILRKENESIGIVEVIACESITQIAPNRFIYDFGQNIAGTVAFDLSELKMADLERGQVITVRYGELLNDEAMANMDDEPGTLWTQNLLTARATDYYVVGDSHDVKISFPHTYHGFRYAEIIGIDQPIPIENIKAYVVASKAVESAAFESSDEMLDKFYKASRYSIRSNLMDVPTDCPQRDERLGWAGDAQVTSLYAMYQYDTEKFYCHYLDEMRAQQNDNGEFTDITPFKNTFGGHNCWGDAPVSIAWNLYLQYGNTEVLAENYEALCKWVDYLVETSNGFLRTSGGYGDHLSSQDTLETLSDTAWCAYSAELVGKIAGVLGKEDDALKYTDISNNYKNRWLKEYVRDDWAMETGILYPEIESETAYSLGICFKIFPEDMLQAAAGRLKILTEYGGYLFHPGYSGMAFYLKALADYGYMDTAIKVMTNTEPGGLMYPIKMGLTTNPEELRVFKDTDENGEPLEQGKYRVTGSLNHAAYSSVCSLLYTNILGITPDENAPGYKHFFISPSACGITHAAGLYNSRQGKISVDWNTETRRLLCTIPTDSTCTLTLPNGEVKELSGGSYEFTW